MSRVLILSSLLCIAPEVFSQTLTYVEVDRPKLLNPVAMQRDISGVRIMSLLFRGLVSRTESGEWGAELAEAIPEFRAGQNELIVHLKDGLKWSDGKSLTAHDVVFSFSVYMDENNNYGNREILEIFESVEAVDNKTVRFALARPDRQAISRLGFYLMPKHMLPGSFIPDSHGFNQGPVGAGPYVVEEAGPDFIHFRLNEHYHKESPSIEKISLVVNPDEAIHTSFLLFGMVDLDPMVSLMDIRQFEAHHQTTLVPYDSSQSFGFAYNSKNSILRFREVRQAFTYIFNRKAALTTYFAGSGNLISGPYSPSSPFYNPKVRPYPWDVMKGVQLLDESGIIDETGDGWRQYNKEKVSLRMVLSKKLRKVNKNVCQDFAQQLRDQGIDVQVIFQDYDTWYQTVFVTRDYDITFISWRFDEASNFYPLFHQSQQEPRLYKLPFFQNAHVDGLLEKIPYTTDLGERTTLGQKFHQVLSEESPFTFLWTLQHPVGYRHDRIARIHIDPWNLFENIDKWEMRQEK